MADAGDQILYHSSGRVVVKSRVVALLYTLMRDHLPPGTLEKIVRDADADIAVSYTNGWLAEYAVNLARRLGDDPKVTKNAGVAER